jgi:hypothetical protein
MVIDVYYKADGHDAATAAVVDIVHAWDDSVYAESNVKGLCGPNRQVVPRGPSGVATINGVRLNCPARFIN